MKIKILDKIFKRPEIDLVELWKYKSLIRTIMSVGMIISLFIFIFVDITGLFIAIILACSYQFMDFVLFSISKQVSKEYKLVKK